MKSASEKSTPTTQMVMCGDRNLIKHFQTECVNLNDQSIKAKVACTALEHRLIIKHKKKTYNLLNATTVEEKTLNFIMNALRQAAAIIFFVDLGRIDERQPENNNEASDTLKKFVDADLAADIATTLGAAQKMLSANNQFIVIIKAGGKLMNEALSALGEKLNTNDHSPRFFVNCSDKPFAIEFFHFLESNNKLNIFTRAGTMHNQDKVNSSRRTNRASMFIPSKPNTPLRTPPTSPRGRDRSKTEPPQRSKKI